MVCQNQKCTMCWGPKDGIGAGFIMQWLDGEALGARIVRAPELDEIRPQLARLFGETLACIHRIDLTTGARPAVTAPWSRPTYAKPGSVIKPLIRLSQ